MRHITLMTKCRRDPREHSHDAQPHAAASAKRHTGSPAHEAAEVSDARLLVSVVLNQLLTVGQVVAGVVSGSSALLSDAAHNFNDANALLIAYVARRVSRRQANRRFTFGYRRAESIGAIINLTVLAVIGLYLIYEAIHRFLRPVEIIGWLMGATALLALVVDVATALLLRAMSRGSLNVRAAFLHNLVDAFGSVAVLLGAAAIVWLDWTWVDPTLTLLIAAYVLWQVARLFPQASRVLMEGTPAELDLDELTRHVTSVDGVAGIHHVHVWELDEQHRALEAHVVIARDQTGQLETIKRAIKQSLANEYAIHHSTLEFEYGPSPDGPSSDDCDDASIIAEH